MKVVPHTHKPKVDVIAITPKGRYNIVGYQLVLIYGDTTVPLQRKRKRNSQCRLENVSERKLRKVLKKAIRLHDVGSLVAGAEEKARAERTALLEGLVEADGQWGESLIQQHGVGNLPPPVEPPVLTFAVVEPGNDGWGNGCQCDECKKFRAEMERRRLSISIP